jgi:hypothetical protein
MSPRVLRARLDRLEARLPKPKSAAKDDGLFGLDLRSLSDDQFGALMVDVDLSSLSDDELEALIAETEIRYDLLTGNILTADDSAKE